MAEDFSKLTAAVTLVGNEIDAVVAQLQNPAVDNNNQTTIDALTSKLTAAASALGSALPPAAVPAIPANGSTDTNPPATPADGSASGDVTPS